MTLHHNEMIVLWSWEFEGFLDKCSSCCVYACPRFFLSDFVSFVEVSAPSSMDVKEEFSADYVGGLQEFSADDIGGLQEIFSADDVGGLQK